MIYYKTTGWMMKLDVVLRGTASSQVRSNAIRNINAYEIHKVTVKKNKIE